MSIWSSKINNDLKVEIKITRQVLFEKFNIKHEMRYFLLSHIDGCEIKFLERYPDSIFFVKNDLILFEQDFKNGHLWVRYGVIWSVFQSKYQLSYEQIQAFITDTLEDQLKSKVLTPNRAYLTRSNSLEDQLRSKVLTPRMNLRCNLLPLEDQLKKQDINT